MPKMSLIGQKNTRLETLEATLYNLRATTAASLKWYAAH